MVLRGVLQIGNTFPGGPYAARIVRTGFQKGDGAEKAFIELLGSEQVLDEKRQKRAEIRAKKAEETRKAMEEADAQAKAEAGAEPAEGGADRAEGGEKKE